MSAELAFENPLPPNELVGLPKTIEAFEAAVASQNRDDIDYTLRRLSTEYAIANTRLKAEHKPHIEELLDQVSALDEEVAEHIGWVRQAIDRTDHLL